jgi:hypothetical protein
MVETSNGCRLLVPMSICAPVNTLMQGWATEPCWSFVVEIVVLDVQGAYH